MIRITPQKALLSFKLGCAVLLLASFAWSDTSSLAHPWRIELEGGRVNPVGDLQNEVGASYFGGWGVGTNMLPTSHFSYKAITPICPPSRRTLRACIK